MAENRQTNSTKSFKSDKDLFLVFSRWATWSVWSWFAPKMLYCSAHVCEKEVKQVLNVTNIRPNKRKKVFKGAMERNPGVEEKEKKARCLWWSIQANIKYQNTMYFLSERVIKNTNILKGSDIGRMGGRRDLFQGKAGNSKGSLSFRFNTKVPWFFLGSKFNSLSLDQIFNWNL